MVNTKGAYIIVAVNRHSGEMLFVGDDERMPMSQSMAQDRALIMQANHSEYQYNIMPLMRGPEG